MVGDLGGAEVVTGRTLVSGATSGCLGWPTHCSSEQYVVSLVSGLWPWVPGPGAGSVGTTKGSHRDAWISQGAPAAGVAASTRLEAPGVHSVQVPNAS